MGCRGEWRSEGEFEVSGVRCWSDVLGVRGVVWSVARGNGMGVQGGSEYRLGDEWDGVGYRG